MGTVVGVVSRGGGDGGWTISWAWLSDGYG